MKRAITAALLPAALLVAGCENDTDINFKTPDQWDSALADTKITCERNQWRENNTLGATALADCYDEHGAVTRRFIFDNQEQVIDRIENIVKNDWIQEIPAVVTGDSWMVECASIEQCKMWQKGLGGKMTETKDFIPS